MPSLLIIFFHAKCNSEKETCKAKENNAHDLAHVLYPHILMFHVERFVSISSKNRLYGSFVIAEKIIKGKPFVFN